MNLEDLLTWAFWFGAFKKTLVMGLMIVGTRQLLSQLKKYLGVREELLRDDTLDEMKKLAADSEEIRQKLTKEEDDGVRREGNEGI